MGIELREQLVGHRCRPRYHSQRADFRQIRDQIIGHPISEVVLFLVPRKIFKRQHHERTTRTCFPLAGVHSTDIMHSNSGNQCAFSQRMDPMITSQERESKIWSVVRVSSGNFLEMYDFMVFGYYASAIGRAFFPSGSPFVSLMLSLMTFGAGFLMRPLGALVLGAYTDRHGRRAGLLLTLGLMSFGIFSIACVPGHATIGLMAPLLVVIGRLLQGFSAGMELGGVSVYLSEIATPGHKGFYVRSLKSNWAIVLVGTFMVTMTTVSFYMIPASTPTFGSSVLHLSSLDRLVVTLCVGASNLFWLPIMGALSDRVGRRPLLLGCTILMLITAYPAMLWLVKDASFSRLLAVELWLSFIYGSYNGAMVVFLTEIMPVEVRTSGFALAYSLATAIFGGFTPALSTYLIHISGNRAIPGLWLSFAAACGLVATLFAKPQNVVIDAERPVAGCGVLGT